jgi:FAD/FMN-containing dehydrogenase
MGRSQTAWKSPKCIFVPKSEDEVVVAVRTVRDSKVKFAVRGGGHSAIPGWANIDAGVLVALSGLADLSYDAATETVRVGAGNTWGKVYTYLEPFHRLVVAGRSPTVGFGMFAGGQCRVTCIHSQESIAYIISGGLSHLSNAYGFATDNVVEFGVVLANGTKVKASARSNDDLFWALKGGSNNYGAVPLH